MGSRHYTQLSVGLPCKHNVRAMQFSVFIHCRGLCPMQQYLQKTRSLRGAAVSRSILEGCLVTAIKPLRCCCVQTNEKRCDGWMLLSETNERKWRPVAWSLLLWSRGDSSANCFDVVTRENKTVRQSAAVNRPNFYATITVLWFSVRLPNMLEYAGDFNKWLKLAISRRNAHRHTHTHTHVYTHIHAHAHLHAHACTRTYETHAHDANIHKFQIYVGVLSYMAPTGWRKANQSHHGYSINRQPKPHYNWLRYDCRAAHAYICIETQLHHGRRREGRWTPTRAKAQDTRASPYRLETHLVRKWGDIGHLRALSPWSDGWMGLRHTAYIQADTHTAMAYLHNCLRTHLHTYTPTRLHAYTHKATWTRLKRCAWTSD